MAVLGVCHAYYHKSGIQISMISTIPRQIYENGLVVEVHYSIKQILFSGKRV